MGQTVLVVDDEQDIRLVLRTLLQMELPDLQVVDAPTAEAALELLGSPVDLVVTDYRMPGMNGMELMRRIHEVHPGLPVILISAYSDPAMESEARAAGAHGFLHKPFDLDAWLAVVRAALV